METIDMPVVPPEGEPPKKKTKVWVIVGIGVVVLCCCCVAIGIGVWQAIEGGLLNF